MFTESLYSYSEPDRVMREDRQGMPRGKRGVRVRLLEARAASSTNRMSLVACDFFGPRVLTAHASSPTSPLP